MSQHTAGGNNNSFNNTNSFNNVWNNCTVPDDRSELLVWLSPLGPGLRHRDIQERRVEDIGEWLVETEKFKKWRRSDGGDGGDNAVLFCYGNPGVGKTFISSLVVDRLCDEARGQNTAVTCFYFDFAARKEQSATGILGSIVKQIVTGMERVPEAISRAFQEQKKAIGGRGPRLPDLVKMLQAITSSQPTFMCIDALDECTAMERFRLFGSLEQILKKSPGTRIFVTGRPHILAEIEKRLAGRVISISVGPSKVDITKYLRVRLDMDETPDAMDESLEADILEMIPENIPETFLLVSLNIEAILQQSTTHRRREQLNRMEAGLGLEGAYGATIERIKAQDGDKSRLGMAALMWISHAERPLEPGELCHALAVELGSRDFSSGNVPSISTLVTCCQGLITVDKEASAVRLVHFTLREYLSSRPDISSRPHATIAEICLTYLNSAQVKAISDDPDPDICGAPFLEYCSLYWGVHAKRELSDCARSLAFELFKESEHHISAKILVDEAKDLGYSSHWFSGLHHASFFGIVELVAALIEMEWYDINEEDSYGYTALTWAADRGQEELVKMLLEREEVNPDAPNIRGETPLSAAAQGGYEEVVRMLLGRKEVNPDKPDEFDQTPLSRAAGNGHEGIVKALLGRAGVRPGEPDIQGETPLLHAARGGYEEVVRMLLGRKEVNPDEPNKYGRTPLSHTAGNGHEGVVKALLKREEVNPDKPDNYGRRPLSYAAINGGEGVVKMLLEREEVNPKMPDNRGRTPLSYAAENGREGVVKMLLERGEDNLDKPDICGRTPLSYAAGYGGEGVVEMLLERQEVNPDKSDKDG